MPARDDFGSTAGTSRGYGGGAGGLGNGGLGGGMGGGMGGGGAARNGGIGSRTGMTTGKTMYGNTAFGRPGGMAQGYATRLTNGQLVDPRLPNGMRPVQAVPAAAPRPPGGLLGPTIEDVPMPPVQEPVIEDVPMPPAFINNPFKNNPTTIADYVMNQVHQAMPTPAPPAAPPAAIQGPAWTGPTGYWQKNPTNYPQYAPNWSHSTWGGAYAPNKQELSNLDWSGPRIDGIKAVGGGQGVVGYTSDQNVQSYSGKRR